jgi:hypothetical protein
MVRCIQHPLVILSFLSISLSVLLVSLSLFCISAFAFGESYNTNSSEPLQTIKSKSFPGAAISYKQVCKKLVVLRKDELLTGHRHVFAKQLLACERSAAICGYQVLCLKATADKSPIMRAISSGSSNLEQTPKMHRYPCVSEAVLGIRHSEV